MKKDRIKIRVTQIMNYCVMIKVKIECIRIKVNELE